MTRGPLDLTPGVVSVWEVGRDEGMGEVARTTEDGTRAPSFRALIISTTGDTLGLQVAGDDLPSGDEDAVLYVSGKGTFELVRVERWPAVAGQKRPRVLLKLKAWPSKQVITSSNTS
jgi:hypothetical protein